MSRTQRWSKVAGLELRDERMDDVEETFEAASPAPSRRTTSSTLCLRLTCACHRAVRLTSVFRCQLILLEEIDYDQSRLPAELPAPMVLAARGLTSQWSMIELVLGLPTSGTELSLTTACTWMFVMTSSWRSRPVKDISCCSTINLDEWLWDSGVTSTSSISGIRTHFIQCQDITGLFTSWLLTGCTLLEPLITRSLVTSSWTSQGHECKLDFCEELHSSKLLAWEKGFWFYFRGPSTSWCLRWDQLQRFAPRDS